MNPPPISVIVPVQGSAVGLEGCLRSLKGQSLRPHEILVVDHGLEGGAERVHAILPSARFVDAGTSGTYAALNGGLRAATGEILAFTGSDCEASADWLREGWMRMSASGASVLAGELEVTASPWDDRTPPEVLELEFGLPQRRFVLSQGFGVTANLMVRREVFEWVGPFDDTLLSGGDLEWGRRAAELGYRTVYEAAALVRHPARRAREELLGEQHRVSEGICSLARNGRLDPEGFLRLVLSTLSPPLVAMAMVLGDPSLGRIGVRMAAAGLLLRLRWERLRSLASEMLREGGI